MKADLAQQEQIDINTIAEMIRNKQVSKIELPNGIIILPESVTSIESSDGTVITI